MKPYEVDASDVLSESSAQLTVDVNVVLDWRFRLGVALVRIGTKLMGLQSTEIRFLPAADVDGHR